jgi:hypothetical protein
MSTDDQALGTDTGDRAHHQKTPKIFNAAMNASGKLTA